MDTKRMLRRSRVAGTGTGAKGRLRSARRRSDTPEVRLSYSPGLDGLRAIAVMAVLLYHADLSFIPGGFLGVEVFFVISGYLITALLLAEWHQKGTINLKDFWLRRARRLLPALYVLLVVTMTFAVVFMPGEVAGLRAEVIAAIGYVTNWFLIFGQESYFETVGRPSVLQHLWSLAVEEQFYLIWPIVLAVGLGVGATVRQTPATGADGGIGGGGGFGGGDGSAIRPRRGPVEDLLWDGHAGDGAAVRGGARLLVVAGG